MEKPNGIVAVLSVGNSSYKTQGFASTNGNNSISFMQKSVFALVLKAKLSFRKKQIESKY